jgi:AraC-like DNA-binding protein
MTAEAALPVIYSEARNALAKCARIDECKNWADRAAALASYAKQADDEQLLNNAKRVKARAIDRMGELAEEIPPAKNQYDAAERARTGADPSRIQVAANVGISPRQLKTALQVHAVPRDEFER